MIIAYRALAFLYVLLLCAYYLLQRSEQTVRPWPFLSKRIPNYGFVDTFTSQPCKADDQCPAKHVCLNGTCVRKLPRGEHCYKPYGQWGAYTLNSKTFAMCTCKEPDIMDQRHAGGNCTLPVACGGHGTLDAFTETCSCEYGFEPGDRYTCNRVPAVKLECGDDEMSAKYLFYGFHADYDRKLLDLGAKCYKEPCTFDVLTGKPLRNNRYAGGFGCVCDPLSGSVGVRVQGNYLRSEGPNACMNIMKHPEKRAVDVDLYQYFYVGDREPITFIAFKGLQRDDVVPVFSDAVRNGTLMVGESWPYNYFQYHLQTGREKQVRYRQCPIAKFIFVEFLAGCSEHLVDKKYPTVRCSDLEERYAKLTGDSTWRHHVYFRLYRYPFCYVDSNHDSVFKGTFVLNPQHVLLEHDFDGLKRSNGLKGTFLAGSRTLFVDLADGFRAEYYLSNNEQTNVPRFS